MCKLLLFLGMLILLLYLFTIKEGFETPLSDTTSSTPSTPSMPTTTSSTGKYDYLAPLPPSNTWNPEIIKKFVNIYNSNLGTGNDNFMLKSDTFTTDEKGKSLINSALEEEAVSYISNGEFPLDLYVSDYLNNNPTAVPEQKFGSITINNKTISKIMPNRSIYGSYISSSDSKLTPPPDTYDIYMGKKPPPSTSDTTPSTTSTTLSPADIDTLKTVSDVQTLKSICSKY